MKLAADWDSTVVIQLVHVHTLAPDFNMGQAVLHVENLWREYNAVGET